MSGYLTFVSDMARLELDITHTQMASALFRPRDANTDTIPPASGWKPTVNHSPKRLDEIPTELGSPRWPSRCATSAATCSGPTSWCGWDAR